MSFLKFMGGSALMLYFVCFILAVMSFPASAADSGESFAWLGAMIERAPVWLTGASMVIATASGVAALTPTPKDDGVLLIARKVLDVLALNVAAARNQGAKGNGGELADRKR